MKRFRFLYKKVAMLFLAMLLPASSIWQTMPVDAANDSLWVNSGSLMHEVENVATDDMTFGLSCKRMDVTHTLLKSGVPTDYTAPNECIVPLEYGALSASGGFFFPKMAKKAGKLYQSKSRMLPVPQTDNFFMQTYRPDIYGTRYITKYEHGSVRQQYATINSSQYAYRLNVGGEGQRVKWDYGRDVITMANQLAISENGKWMIARATSGKVLRINLETLDVVTAFDTGGGWPNPRGKFEFAISDDGRYGVVSGGVSSMQGDVRLIDFSLCESGTEQTGEVTPGCGVRDITDYIEEISDGERRIYKPSFTAENTQIQMNVTLGGEAKRIALIAPGETYSGLDYLALGDSFASGEGDHDDVYYEPGTNVPISDDLPEGEKCHLSRRSYPYLIAQTLDISKDRFKSVACSGAETEDISNKSYNYLGQQRRLERFNRGKIDQMKEEALRGFVPGRVGQIQFVERYKPKIVTISIGGNDAGFAEIIKECVMFISECDYASSEDSTKRFKKAWRVQELVDELTDLYTQVHKASEKTKIYVLGYSKLMKKDGQCSPFFGFNDNEREFMDEAFSYMNQIVEAAATRVGVEYLDVENALDEAVHCGSEEPNAANGVKVGDDIPLGGGGSFRVIGAETYHPNQHGHAKISQHIAHKINETHCQPGSFVCPQEAAFPEIPDYFKLPANSVTYPNRELAFVDKEQYMVGENTRVEQSNLFAYSSSVDVSLHSDPYHLGTFQADENGSLDAAFTIPEDVPAGYHTLRLKGTLISGEEVEFDQTILVLGREGDRDNDGTPDIEQDCLAAPIAVTDGEGNVVVPPCAELDASFTEVISDSDKEQEETPRLEESIAAARQAIRQFLEDSEYYQRLPFAEQQNLIALLERQATPRIANLITHCSERPESTIFDLGFLRVVVGCRKMEEGIQLNMNLYLGPLRVLFSAMMVERQEE